MISGSQLIGSKGYTRPLTTEEQVIEAVKNQRRRQDLPYDMPWQAYPLLTGSWHVENVNGDAYEVELRPEMPPLILRKGSRITGVTMSVGYNSRR